MISKNIIWKNYLFVKIYFGILIVEFQLSVVVPYKLRI